MQSRVKQSIVEYKYVKQKIKIKRIKKKRKKLYRKDSREKDMNFVLPAFYPRKIFFFCLNACVQCSIKIVHSIQNFLTWLTIVPFLALLDVLQGWCELQSTAINCEQTWTADVRSQNLRGDRTDICDKKIISRRSENKLKK